MPIHLSTRRDFLRTLSATATGLLTVPYALSDELSAEADVFALLSDTHVPKDRTISNGGVNMTENLERVIGQVLAEKPKPAGVIINGDCAFLKGLAEDYANFSQTLAPLVDASLPVHLTLGNHDHRERMYAQFRQQRPDRPIVEGKHVSILEMPRANWFLLDSLYETDVVTGVLGEEQIRWLTKSLDAHADKPAILMAHHHPQWRTSGTVSGLKETEELFAALARRKHVKAYIYGHTHRWGHDVYEGIHLINLPPTAYVFEKSLPNGWVAAQVGTGGIKLQIHTLDGSHAENGRVVDLAWRT